MSTYRPEDKGPEVRVRTRRGNEAQRSVLIPGLRSVPALWTGPEAQGFPPEETGNRV